MDWYKIIEIAIGSIIPIIIMGITLRFTKRQNEYSLNEQKKEFEKSFEAQEKYYLENHKMTQEQHRLSIMPYLILEKINIGYRNGNPVFNITLKNIGNNIATSISVTYKEKPNIITTYELNSAKREYLYSGYLFDNILQVNKTGEFEVSLLYNTTDIIPEYISTFKNYGELKFTITFFDIQMNKYSQSFFFQYNIANEDYPIGRQETSPPRLDMNN